MIVVDVNVMAYLLIEGEHTAAAEALLAADPEWASPLLWRSEWRNVLAGYLRRGELDRAGTLLRIELASRLVAGREYMADDHSVMRLVEESGCSAYDCEYVAVAEALGVPLVTNDGALLRAFPDQVVRPSAFVSRS